MSLSLNCDKKRLALFNIFNPLLHLRVCEIVNLSENGNIDIPAINEPDQSYSIKFVTVKSVLSIIYIEGLGVIISKTVLYFFL